jgi:hypothetical protein
MKKFILLAALLLHFIIITYILKVRKVFWSKDFLVVLWRNKWQNRDAGAKWAVKKGAPAGKYDIKRADSR